MEQEQKKQTVTHLSGWKPYEQDTSGPGWMTPEEHCQKEEDHHFNSMGQCAVCGGHRAPVR